jgi:Tfp pilus assembly protein FimT
MLNERTGRKGLGQSGFSMLEAVATIVIALILSSVMIPQMVGMARRARLNGATRELVSVLSKTRMEAVSKNKTYALKVIDYTTYVVYRDENEDGTFGTDESVETYDLSSGYPGVKMKASRDVEFSPKGTVLSTVFKLGNDSGTKSVRVNIAGRVKIES